MRDARKLRVLVIEDREKIGGSDFEKYLDIDLCAGVKPNMDHNAAGALDLLARYQKGDPRPALDILVVDVDMSNDRALHGWQKDKTTTWDPSVLFKFAHQHPGGDTDSVLHDLAPYGPIISLPFISYASMLFIVQPVSAYWEQPAVYNNGFFLVAMSLIATVAGRGAGGGTISPDDVQRALRTGDLETLGLAGRSGTTLLEDGIRASLQALRHGMKENFYFLGLEPAITRIATALNQCRSGALMRADLLPALDGLSIDLQSARSNAADRIFLTSLFADTLVQRRGSVDIALDAILATLRQWSDDERINMFPLLHRLRAEVMDKIWLPGAPAPREGLSARALLGRLNINKQSPQFLAARRYMMLMAWTRAWHHFLHEGCKGNLKVLAEAALGMGDNPNDWQRLACWGNDRPLYVQKHAHLHFLDPFWYVDGADAEISDYYLDDRTAAQLRLRTPDLSVCRHYLAYLDRHRRLSEVQAARLPPWLR